MLCFILQTMYYNNRSQHSRRELKGKITKHKREYKSRWLLRQTRPLQMLLQDFSRKIFRIVGSISLEDVNLV